MDDQPAGSMGFPIQDEELLAAAGQDLGLYVSVMFPQFEMWHHHKAIIEALEDVEAGRCDRLAITMPPRHGKLCADSTPVLTTEGWSTHGQLRVGHRVFGPDGKPTRVIAVSAPSMATLEVVTTTGSIVKCHPAHEWTVYDRTAAHERTVETRAFVEPARKTGTPWKLWAGNRGSRGGRVRFQLPLVAPLNFRKFYLPVDPYVLGVWLGDGTSVGTKITMAPADMAVVLPELEAAGCVLASQWMHSTTGVATASIGGPKKGRRYGRLHGKLRALGVLGDKHIPERYLRSSITQRLQLLAGLVDTDGHVETHTGRVRIVTGQPRLRDGIVDLATTLGFRPYVTEALPVLSTSGIQGRKVVFTIGFQPTMPLPTRLARKRLVRFAPQRRIGIADVRIAAEPEVGRCIQVACPDGLYLVGRELIPTHNSLLCSEHFPAWALGKKPDRQIISMTYAKDLANDFGRSVRNQIADPFYQLIFPGVVLRRDSKAANRFNTPQKGSYFAGGRNSPMTGRGAHIFLVDDPIKNQQEADSPVVRKSVIQTYESVALTRLMTGGAVILIQTRWHEDDLCGHVLRNHKHDNWRLLEMPAIDQDGRALWEPKFPRKALLRTKASISARAWSALYQQRPTTEDGAILLRKYWQPWTAPVPDKPSFILISLDTAYTDKEQNDYSACTIWHVVEAPYFAPVKPGAAPVTPDMRIKLLLRYAWRKRLVFPDLLDEIVATVKHFAIRNVPLRVLIENKASGLSVIQEMRRRLPDLGIHVAEANKGKVARAHSVTAMMEAGRVYALADVQFEGEEETRTSQQRAVVFRPWAAMVIDECAAFPVGAHDDLVDSTTHGLRHIRDMGVELFAEDAPEPASAHEPTPLY